MNKVMFNMTKKCNIRRRSGNTGDHSQCLLLLELCLGAFFSLDNKIILQWPRLFHC